jgi:thiol-disulfide isomerase/thioredoxin/protein-disulfide isomerase/uncharacterized membrane protein
MSRERWSAILPAVLLSAIAAGLSAALLVQHAGQNSTACTAEDGSCEAVLASGWAVFPPAADGHAATAGLPVAAYGVGYFVGLAAWLLLIGPVTAHQRRWHWVPLGVAAVGGLVSLVLLGTMWRLGQWCPLCLTIHLLNFGLLALVGLMWPTASAINQPADAPAEQPLGRLAVAAATWGVCAWLGSASYARQLAVEVQNRELAQQLEQLRNDRDLLGGLYANQPVQTIPQRADDPGVPPEQPAQATLVVFSDAFCRHCQTFKQRLHDEILPEFAGRLTVEYKQFPLCGDCNPGAANAHPLACEAAWLMEAAREQGGAEAYLKLGALLEAPRSTPWSDAEVTRLADEVGLDAARLLVDRRSPQVKARVLADVRAARAAGVTAIPAVFLNGRAVSHDLRESREFWHMAAQGALTGGPEPVLHAATSPAKPPRPATRSAVTTPPVQPAPNADVASNTAAQQAAGALIEEFDKDLSGQLEQAEWKEMRGNVASYDRNQDLVLTRDELLASIVSVNTGRGGSQKNAAAVQAPKPEPRTSSISLGQELEIAGPTLDGQTIDLRDYRGKVVLVDFWATWCGFCVEETPYLQRLYEKYHAQGLEIIGVNVDHTKENLQRFVADNHLPWPQIFFDEDGRRGRDNPVSRQHLIRGFPQMVLVDRTGKVVDLQLRGHKLEAAIAGALGVEPTPTEKADAEVKQLAVKLVRPERTHTPPAPGIEVGQMLDIAGKTVDGQDFDVKQWRGKVVLVAYWASWCPHCKKELPNLEEVYARHHADGFEIVGISADRSASDLTGYLSQHPQPWPTLYRDEEGYRGLDHPLCWRYGVTAIPMLALLDREGKVVHVKPRGPVLEQEVAKLLGKEPVLAATAPVELTVAKPAPKFKMSTNPADYDDRELAQQVVQRFDANGDGVLQADEWKQMQGQPASYDKDGDGLVTVEEFEAAVRAAKKNEAAKQAVAPPNGRKRPSAPPSQPNTAAPLDLARQIVEKFDADRDGKLSTAEWGKMPGTPKIFDRNTDGELTAEELSVAISSAREPVAP